MLFQITTDCFPTRFQPSEDSSIEQWMSEVVPNLVEYVQEVLPSFTIIRLYEGSDYGILLDVDEGEIEDYCLRDSMDSYVEDGEKVYVNRQDWEYVDKGIREELFSYSSIPSKDDIVYNEEPSLGHLINYFMHTRLEGFDNWSEICNIDID